jgi:resuscitation-promoting factor RpfB
VTTAKTAAAKLTGAQRYDLANWTLGQTPTLMQALGVTSPPAITGLTASGTSPSTTTPPAPDSAPVAPPSSGSDSANQALGQQMAAAQPYGWTGAQWTALNNIVMAESGWDDTAKNPSSGAYGIPQALPGSKMASAGANWQTSAATQIKWMLLYIQQRYGNPVSAWAFHLANGWY